MSVIASKLIFKKIAINKGQAEKSKIKNKYKYFRVGTIIWLELNFT